VKKKDIEAATTKVAKERKELRDMRLHCGRGREEGTASPVISGDRRARPQVA